MATTITTPSGTTVVTRPVRNNSYQVVYWIIGLAVALAIALFFVMQRNASMTPEAALPTTFEQQAVPSDTTVPTDTTTNPAAPAPPTGPNTGNPATDNRY